MGPLPILAEGLRWSSGDVAAGLSLLPVCDPPFCCEGSTHHVAVALRGPRSSLTGCRRVAVVGAVARPRIVGRLPDLRVPVPLHQLGLAVAGRHLLRERGDSGAEAGLPWLRRPQRRHPYPFRALRDARSGALIPRGFAGSSREDGRRGVARCGASGCRARSSENARVFAHCSCPCGFARAGGRARDHACEL